MRIIILLVSPNEPLSPKLKKHKEVQFMRLLTNFVLKKNYITYFKIIKLQFYYLPIDNYVYYYCYNYDNM